MDMSPVSGLVITTDGASRQNPGPAGSGGIIELGKNTKNYIKFAAAIGKHSNNVAELYAIGLGLKILFEDKNITHQYNANNNNDNVNNDKINISIFTDSSYAVGIFQNGNKIKKNKEIIIWIKKLILNFNKLNINCNLN